MLIDFTRRLYQLDYKESKEYKLKKKGESKVKKYSLSGWKLRKAGIYFKDSAGKSLHNRTVKELKEIVSGLELTDTIPDILEKLTHLTEELNKYYKEV